MLFTVNFGAAQTGVGYRFSTGSEWVGARVTAGITEIGDGVAGGNYSVDVEPPATALVIYWDCDNAFATSQENFDLRLKVDALNNISTANIRTELAAELARIDVDISSRSSHTPANVRTELTTELARIDVATSTRLATAGYTAPNNAQTTTLEERLSAVRAGYLDKLNVAGILAHSEVANLYKADITTLESNASAIKAKTDSLVFTTAGKVDARVDAVGATVVTGPNDFKANVSLLALETTAQSVKIKTDLIPTEPAAIGSEMSLSNAALATIWSQANVIDGLTPANALAVLVAICAGITEGFGEPIVKFQDLQGLLDRVTVTRDPVTKNRLQVTLSF